MCKECELEGINFEFQELFHENKFPEHLSVATATESELIEEIDELVSEHTSQNENALTDQVFFARYPELRGKKLTRAHAKFELLKKEWLSIRDNIVRKAAVTPAPTGMTPSPAGKGSTLAKAAAAIARQEWARWDYGKREEREPDMQIVIREYWKQSVGYEPASIDYAWSAVFISWVVKKAGAGNLFKYDPFHTTYVHNAIHHPNAVVKGFRTTARAPQVGDIVVRNRGTSNFTFDSVKPKVAGTHGDIVVNVRAGAIDVIGGNKSNARSGTAGVTVNQATIKTNAQGMITNPQYFAIVALS